MGDLFERRAFSDPDHRAGLSAHGGAAHGRGRGILCQPRADGDHRLSASARRPPAGAQSARGPHGVARGDLHRPGDGRAQYDRHRRGRGHGRDHRRGRVFHGPQQRHGGRGRDPVRRQCLSAADPDRPARAVAGHGPADHGQLSGGGLALGRGAGGTRRRRRPRTAADHRASVCVLFRPDGGFDPAGLSGGLCGLGHLRRKSAAHRGAELSL